MINQQGFSKALGSTAAWWSMTVLITSGLYTSTAMAGPIEDCNTLRGAAALAPCTTVIDDNKQTPASRSLAFLMRARAAIDMSNLNRAEADIKAALALQPNSPFGYRIRGRLRSVQGRNAEARADYTTAIQRSDAPGGKYVSYVDRGHFLLRIADLPAALADFEAAVRLDPAKAPAYVGRALSKKATGNIAEALADLDRAKAVEPGYWLTYVEQGDILLAEARYAEALAAFNLALTIRKDDARAQNGRAAASSLANANRISAPAAPTVTPSAPSEPRPAAPSPVPAPTTTAPTTLPPSAPGTATPAAPSPAQPATAPQPPTITPRQLQPGDAVEPAAQLAEERRGKLKEAFDLRRAGKPAEAIAIYDALLRQTPADAEAAVEKGRTLMVLAKWKEALEAFKLVVENKAAPAGMRALAFEGQGEVFARNNLHDQAVGNMTAALQINPKLVGALYWRGVSSYWLGAPGKAAADFHQANLITPKSALYLGWEAIALVSAGDLLKAREAVTRAFSIQTNHPIALTARARLRLVTGELEAAEADLAQLTQAGPLVPVALEAQQLIMIHKVMKQSDQPLVHTRQ